MYNFIHDLEELKYFYDTIMPDLKDFEVYFISLSARNKYLSKEEQKELSLGRTEMFSRRIVRKKDFDRLVKTLRTFEASPGSYITKNGSNIPNKCITVYWNINPSNSLKAYKEFNSVMNEYYLELGTAQKHNNISDRINKMDVLLMNCYQKNRGTKKWIDIDFDIDKNDIIVIHRFCEVLKNKNIKYHVIDTHSGFHILLDRDTVKFNFNELINETKKEYLYHLTNQEIKKKSDIYTNNVASYDSKKIDKILHDYFGYEIINNKNAMIPLPGTYAGDYPIRVLKEI